MLLLLETMNFLLPAFFVINELLRYSTVTTFVLAKQISNCKQSYRVISRLIQQCFLSKIVYLNVKYFIATGGYDFFYICAKSHWKYHTFEGYYICSFSKLRHKAHQKV